MSDDICKNGRVKYENHQIKYDEYKDKNGIDILLRSLIILIDHYNTLLYFDDDNIC